MKYYIIAGEASGDLHGSNLIKGLKRIDRNCTVRCWGGDLMQEAGGELVKHYNETAVMGFWEVLRNLKKILGNLKACKRDIRKWDPDLVILIDYPGFNFRIARFAHKKGFKVYYYIAPKIWAWRENRGKRLKKFVDKLFIIFPFEIEYFKKRWNIDAIYKGNPLIDSVDRYPHINETKAMFCDRINTGVKLFTRRLNPSDHFIALIAGSRKGEISYLLPRMLKVMEKYPDYKFLLAAAPSIPDSYYYDIVNANLEKSDRSPECRAITRSNLHILHGETYSIMKHSDAAIISSGTASLEAAIIGVPQVVCYGASEISYQIAKRLVKGVKYISLANLILDKQIFKELIQHDCTPEIISVELDRILTSRSYSEAMKSDYAKVREALGGGGASEAVAKAIVEQAGPAAENRNKQRSIRNQRPPQKIIRGK